MNLLLPLKSFDIRVSKRPILGKEAVISWMDENGRQREEAVPLPYNRDIAQTNRKVNLVSVIQPSGQVDALLQPSSE